MNNSLQWKVTSLRIPLHCEFNEFIDKLQIEGIKLRENPDFYTLENQEEYFIYENEYLSQSTNISTNIKKFSQKNYDTSGKVYSDIDGQFSSVIAESKDKEKYIEVIANNIIDGDIREILISPNVLNEVLDNSKQSRLFLDILLLLFLANKSKYDAETIEAEFKSEDSYYRMSLNITKHEPLFLYPLYDWILNNEEYENSYEIKLQVVRQVIVIKKDISNINGILEDCKLAFKRIISRKTNDYFDQINKLKDDFFVMTKSESSALRTLNLTFFAWLGYLGVELFGIISKYNGDSILTYLLFSGGEKKGIVILLFIGALTSIFVAYILEISSLKKTYEVIKQTYKDKILFEINPEENKFENMIIEPKVGKLQKLLFTLLIIVLFFRFFLTFPW